MALGAWLLAALVGVANGLASTDTITWGGDNTRAGYQTYVVPAHDFPFFCGNDQWTPVLGPGSAVAQCDTTRNTTAHC